jgi:hypothetical protein
MNQERIGISKKDYRSIRQARKLYKKFSSQNKQTGVVIVHNIVPLYNPIEKTYQSSGPNDFTQWIVEVNLEKKPLNRFLINVLYRDIQFIMKWIIN